MVFLTPIISFALVLFITPLIMRMAYRLDFLDYPKEHKLHFEPTPLLGGVGVFLGFWLGLIIGLFLVDVPWKGEVLGLFLGSLAIIALGLVDDKRGMSPSVKFIGQIAASLIFIVFGRSAGIFSGSLWDVLVLIVWMVGLMNALNFLDNMDGLCSGISVIAALAFFVLAYFTSNPVLLLISLALTGSLLGFLKYNFSPAKIFLGDTGSMLCGFVLSASGLIFTKQSSYYLNGLVPVLILSYPIFDISFVTFTRLKEGRRFYQGGCDHSSHRIVEMGIHPRLTVWGIYFICLVLAAMGVIMFFFLDSPMKILVAVFIGIFLTILGIHLNRNFAYIKSKAMLVLADVLTINLLFLFVYWLRLRSHIFPVRIVIPLAEYTAPAIWITLFWINLFAVLGLYDFDWEASLKGMWKLICGSVGLGVVIFVILTLGPDYLLLRSWALLSIYTVSLILLLITQKSVLMFWFRALLAKRKIKRKAVIVGTGNYARKLGEDLDSDAKSSYQVVGFVEGKSGHADLKVGHLRILGGIDDLNRVLKENRAHEVLIALESEEVRFIPEIINKIVGIEVNFKVPLELSCLVSNFRVSGLYGGKFLRLRPWAMSVWECWLKRLWDVVFSVSALVVSSPVLFLTWIMLKLRFKSTVLAGQTYVGKSKKEFKVYSFRLCEQKEEDSVLWTKIDGFLRRSGMQKLPILFNILKGEMSFVGSGLIRAQENTNLQVNAFEYNGNCDMRPGLWSRWELAHCTSQEQAGDTRRGVVNAEHMSLWLDVKIFLKGIVNLTRKAITNP